MQEALQYWRRALRWSWLSLRAYWHAWLVSCLVWVAADVFLFKIYGRSVASQVETQSAISEIIPGLLVFFLLLFIVGLIVAPIKLDKQALARITELDSQIKKLQERFTPVFSIRHEQDNSSYYYCGGASNGGFKLIRIGIFNESLSTIHNVEVKLTRVIVCPEAMGKLPVPLHIKGDNTGPPFRKSATISSRGELLIDVVQWIWRPSGGQPRLSFCSAEEGVDIIGAPGVYEYEITVHVTGDGVKDITKSFKTCLEDTRLTLLEV